MVISSIESSREQHPAEQKETRGAAGHAATARGYCGRVETELSNICTGILRLLDKRLVPAAATVDAKIFYLKIKGDYHCYLAEFKTGAERKDAADSTLAAYQAAQVPSSSLFHQLSSRRLFLFFFVPFVTDLTRNGWIGSRVVFFCLSSRRCSSTGWGAWGGGAAARSDREREDGRGEGRDGGAYR
ncbi:14-3-3-like protein GF14-A [Panicum virgatum]|uniref:14-3-3-like protein GF14-A n=1 Tax=Panicum virgatum TaxID=38727 RepID=UPI0019D56B6F|nr:14-3-3-like protein GF14-A [Panicum virgatum]